MTAAAASSDACLFVLLPTHSAVAAVLLLQTGPKASLYLTLVGILAGFFSTSWSFGYQRTAARMQEYLDGANVAKVKKQEVSRGSEVMVVCKGCQLWVLCARQTESSNGQEAGGSKGEKQEVRRGSEVVVMCKGC